MDYKFLITKFEQVNNELQLKSIIDQATGEVIDFNFILNSEETIFYVDNLDIFYVYFVNFLIYQGYNSVSTNNLNQKEFKFSLKSGKCSNIVFKTNNFKIYIVNYKSKFGLEFNENYQINKQILDYAIKHGRLGITIGQDAYNEFLLTRFRQKEDNNINHKLFREQYPILEENQDFITAKYNCAGFQFVKKGYYTNIYEYDQQSSYPAQMLNDSPVGEPIIFENINKVPNNYFKIIKFCYIDKVVKENKIDFIGAKNGVCCLTEHLFNLFKENYNCKIKILKIYAFKTRKGLFNKFINSNILDGKIHQKNPYIAKYNKRIANSLCGYLGRNTESFASICVKSENGIEFKNINIKIDPIYLPAYLYFVGKAKTEFIEKLQKIKGLIYANTDGFLTTEKVSEMLLNYNYSTEIGSYKTKTPYSEIYIDCINGYAGTRIDGSVDNTISGMKISSRLTAEQYQSKKFTYTINRVSAQGTIYIDNCCMD